MLNCPICQDVISYNPTDNNYPWVLSCGHVYHKICIGQSLHRNNTCPICRKVVLTSFRLFLEEQDREGTLTFLQGCVQNTEDQYARQKKISQTKDSFIRELQNALEEGEEKTTRLRTSYGHYVATVIVEKEKLNDEIKTLQDEIKKLLDEIKKLQEEKQKLYEDLHVQLEVENGLFTAMCRAKMKSEVRLTQQIHTLNGEVSALKQEALARERARLDELEQLLAEMDKHMAQAKKCDCNSMPKQTISEVIDLEDDVEEPVDFSDLSSSRKRKNGEESSCNVDEGENPSTKQPRLHFGDTTISIVKCESEPIPRRSRLQHTRKGLGDAILEGPVIEIE